MKAKPKGPKYRNLYTWRGSIWYERVAHHADVFAAVRDDAGQFQLPVIRFLDKLDNAVDSFGRQAHLTSARNDQGGH